MVRIPFLLARTLVYMSYSNPPTVPDRLTHKEPVSIIVEYGKNT